MHRTAEPSVFHPCTWWSSRIDTDAAWSTVRGNRTRVKDSHQDFHHPSDISHFAQSRTFSFPRSNTFLRCSAFLSASSDSTGGIYKGRHTDTIQLLKCTGSRNFLFLLLAAELIVQISWFVRIHQGTLVSLSNWWCAWKRRFRGCPFGSRSYGFCCCGDRLCLLRCLCRRWIGCDIIGGRWWRPISRYGIRGRRVGDKSGQDSRGRSYTGLRRHFFRYIIQHTLVIQIAIVFSWIVESRRTVDQLKSSRTAQNVRSTVFCVHKSRTRTRTRFSYVNFESKRYVHCTGQNQENNRRVYNHFAVLCVRDRRNSLTSSSDNVEQLKATGS